MPIHRKLEVITKLFRPEWLTSNDYYGMSQQIDGPKIKQFFDDMIDNGKGYCKHLLKGIVNADCTEIGLGKKT